MFVDSNIKEVGNINIIQKHLLLRVTGKKLDKEEALFDCFNRSWI